MGPVVATAYSYGATPAPILVIRFGAAFVVVLLAGAFKSNRNMSVSVTGLVGGLVGGALAGAFEYRAYGLIPIGIVVVILFSAPAWVILHRVIARREKPPLPHIVAVLLVLAGLLILADAGGLMAIRTLGLVYAVLASLCVATIFILGEFSLKDSDPIEVTFWFVAGAALGSIVLMVPGGASLDQLVHPPVIMAGAAVGLVGTALAMWLLFLSIEHLGPVETSLVTAIEPAFAATWGWLFLGQHLKPADGLGVLLILTAGILATRYSADSPGVR